MTPNISSFIFQDGKPKLETGIKATETLGHCGALCKTVHLYLEQYGSSSPSRQHRHVGEKQRTLNGYGKWF